MIEKVDIAKQLANAYLMSNVNEDTHNIIPSRVSDLPTTENDLQDLVHDIIDYIFEEMELDDNI